MRNSRILVAGFVGGLVALAGHAALTPRHHLDCSGFTRTADQLLAAMQDSRLHGRQSYRADRLSYLLFYSQDATGCATPLQRAQATAVLTP